MYNLHVTICILFEDTLIFLCYMLIMDLNTIKIYQVTHHFQIKLSNTTAEILKDVVWSCRGIVRSNFHGKSNDISAIVELQLE